MNQVSWIELDCIPRGIQTYSSIPIWISIDESVWIWGCCIPLTFGCLDLQSGMDPARIFLSVSTSTSMDQEPWNPLMLNIDHPSGNGNHTTYKHADDWGMVCCCFKLFYPHDFHFYLGVSIVMGVPQNGGFLFGKIPI